MEPAKSRKETSVIEHEGYTYKRKKTVAETEYYVCNDPKIKCSAKLYVKHNKRWTKGTHFHGKRQLRQKIEKFKDALWGETIESEESFKNIYNELSIKDEWRRVAPRVPAHSVARSMHRWRRQYRPPVPGTLEEYADLINSALGRRYREYGDGAFSVKTTPVDDRTSVTVIGDPKFIASLGNIQILHVDATFQVCPKNPKVSQFFTIMARVDDTAIPIAWALMNRKTEKAYVAMFKDFRDRLAPNLRPKTVYSDFEIGIRNAFQKIYPEIVIIHCYFHYCQAIFRRLLRKGKTAMKQLQEWETGKVFLRKLFALALLPPDDIPGAYEQLLQNTAQDIYDFYKDVIGYYARWWLNQTGSSRFSVYRLQLKTNNSIEAYHRTLQLLMGKHPGIWPFTAKLKQLQITTMIKVDSLKMGELVRRPVERKYVMREKVLLRLWDLYDEKSICVVRFLACASHISEAMDNGLVITRPQQVDQFIDSQAHHVDVQPKNIGIVRITVTKSKKRTPIPIIRQSPPSEDVEILILDDIRQSLCGLCQRGILNVQAYPCQHWYACENCTREKVWLAFKQSRKLNCSICLKDCVVFKVEQVT